MPPWPEPLDRPGDLAACRARLRLGSRSFTLAALLLPPAVARDATALYAFCREADDAVDRDREAGAVARLRWRLELAAAGRPLPQPVDRALAATLRRHAIPEALPLALLEGLAWDAQGRRYPDLAGLLAYAARVAGAVGVMMALVMGARDPQVLARAADLGVAMQLTNIARDVAEDARAGRLYLPERWLREAGLDPAAWLLAPSSLPGLAAVLRRLLAVAGRLYRRAASGIAALPAACRPGIHAARLIYAEIGRELERRGLDPLAGRAVVAPGRKLALLGQALLLAAASARPSPAPPLAACRFLVEAVAAAPAPPKAPSLEQRLVWVLDLFERLERRERGEQPGRAGG